jgi:hydroxymethylpyrimidine pyrophosphatase-like HAD family hydrolase
MENRINREVLGNSNRTVWMFDVDGVITNPAEKRVTEKGLIEAIAGKLDKGDVVTLNTGRSISWMTNRVLNPLKEAVSDKSKLDNFLAVGEKGGTWACFKDGELIPPEQDEVLAIPDSLKKTIKDLIEKDYDGKMFFDDSKLTMLSTEMIDGRSTDEYAAEQRELVKKMVEILEKPEYNHLGLRIDPTTIATDIQNSHVGKHFGARRIANWLAEKEIKPTKIIAIGDSQSDTEMVEELQGEFNLEFVFVGDGSKLKSDSLNKPPTFTKARFGEGTLEYLLKSSD